MRETFKSDAGDGLLPPLGWLFGLVAMVAALSFGALKMNEVTGGITVIWPSNGLMTGVLLCSRRRQWPALLVVAVLVDLAVNLFDGSAPFGAAYLAGCNLVEVLMAAGFLERFIAPDPDLTRRRQLLALLFYGVLLAPAFTALLAAIVLSQQQHVSFGHSFRIWFVADVLGMSTVLPLYLSFHRGDPLERKTWLEAAGLFLLLGAATAYAFSQPEFTFLFLVLPCLLLLGVRLGLAGSAAGLVMVALIGGLMAALRHGPLSLRSGWAMERQVLVFQFFIATAMLVLYIVEIVTAERNRLQNHLKSSEMRFRLLTETSRDVILLLGLDGRRQYVSPAVTEILGWEPEELVGGADREVCHPDDAALMARLFEDTLAGNPPRVQPYRSRKKTGGYLWLEANMRLFRDERTGEPIGFVSVVRDISGRKAAEDELNKAFRMVENLARIDGLTGIANRRRLDETLDREWRRAVREQTHLSLLLIDVDHFKNYNDLYGHLAGDDCLRRVAEAATETVHRPADLLARFGGEEFALILPNTDALGALEIAEQMRKAVEQRRLPHPGNPHRVITISIGCSTVVPQRGDSVELLLQIADKALYQAKARGRNRVEATLIERTDTPPMDVTPPADSSAIYRSPSSESSR